MSRLKTCKLCGKSIQPNETPVPFGIRFAHETCFENWTIEAINQKNKELKNKGKKQKDQKPVKELKNGLSEEEYKEKTKYYDYFRKVLGKEQLPVKIYKLTDDYIRLYNVNYLDLYHTLVYVNEILQKQLKGDIIGLLPFYITQAQAYFIDVKQIEKEIEKIDLNKMYSTKNVKINKKEKRIPQMDIISL